MVLSHIVQHPHVLNLLLVVLQVQLLVLLRTVCQFPVPHYGEITLQVADIDLSLLQLLQILEVVLLQQRALVDLGAFLRVVHQTPQ